MRRVLDHDSRRDGVSEEPWLHGIVVEQVHSEERHAEGHDRGLHHRFLREFGLDASQLPFLMMNRADWVNPFRIVQ